MFYAIKLAVIALLTVVLSLLTVLCGMFDAQGKRVYRINQIWTRLVLKFGGITLNVKGLNQLDPLQHYIFVVNHQSNLDIPVLVQALHQFQLRWIAKKELLWIPFFGWAMWATKHITVDRADALDARRSLEVAKRRMAAGISLVIFPEGTRSTDGGLLPFKRGGFLLALKSKTPIVPVTINGTGQLLGKGAWRLRQGTINVTVSAPLTAEDFGPGGLRSLAAQVQARIAANLQTNDTWSAGHVNQTSAAIESQGRTV